MSTEVLEGFELSPQQKHVWLLQQRDGLAAYRSRCTIAVNGELDTATLARALRNVVERHELLRTRFRLLPGMALPLQVISSDAEFSYVWRDLSALPPEEREAQRKALLECVVVADGDNGDELPLRVTHLVFDTEQHLLAIELPGMCADAVSLCALAQQIRNAYVRCTNGLAEPELPAQYADIAETLNQCIESEEFDFGRLFWRERAANGLALAKAPFEPGTGSFRSRSVNVPLASSLVGIADEFCVSSGISRESLFLACWGLLMSRMAAADRVLIGLCCDGRTHDSLWEAIGPLSRHVPFTFELRQGGSFEEIAHAVDATRADVVKRQHYFDPKAFDDLAAAAGRNHGVCFEYVRLVVDGNTEGPVFTTESLFSTLDSFAIKLTVIEVDASLRCQLEYDASISESDILRIAGHFVTLLASALRNPGRRGRLLPILSVEERRAILAISQGPETRLETLCVQELFEKQVKERPDSVAVVCEEQQLSYLELNRRANQLARYLRRLAVGPEMTVGLCMERSPEMITGLLAVLKAGAAYVPMDPNYPAERLAQMLDDSQVAVALTQERLKERLRVHKAQVFKVDTDQKEWAEERGANLTVEMSERSLAYVIYTSGSTARPKGVGVEHAQLVTYVKGIGERLKIEPGWKMGLVSTMSADLGYTMLYPSLCLGGELHVVSEACARDRKTWVEYQRERQVDCMKITPTHVEALVEDKEAMPGRLLVLGGEVCSREWVRRMRERAPWSEVVNHYGPTECTVGTVTHRVEDSEEGTVPIGRPLGNVRVYVLDEGCELVPVFAPGELYIGGGVVGRGYLNDHAQTAERFVPDGVSGAEGVRLYRTGDKVRWSREEQLEYLGRLDDQVKVRGYRIELGEIETVLGEHEGVRQCAVIVREDEPGDKALVAYVVASGEGVVSSMELREYLRGKLPEYMVPWRFVELERLPLTPNGKLDRKALAAGKATETATESEEPRTPVEEIMAGIWAEVLKLERVGARQNFFELGGHSLLATQVISRIRDVLEAEVPLRVMFESPTPAGLAEAVERERKVGSLSEAPPIRRVDRDRDLPLSFAQQRLWFIHQLEPDSPAYNIRRAMRLKGSLKVSALSQSLQEIARRHEVLRTRFETRYGQPRQVIEDPSEVELPVWDVSELEEADLEQQAQELVGREARRPFDLERGPVWRAALIRMGVEDHLLVLCIHHAASDGWSTSVLVREFTALYESYRLGHTASLPDLSVQYPDFAVWQREWLQGEVLDEEVGYWRRQLEGAPVLDLPTDRPRPPVATHLGAKAPFKLSTELTQELKDLSRQEGTTLFMTLLAGFQLVLGRHAGQDDVVVGTDVANRNRLETEELIGFFVNQLVLRTDLSGNPSLRELVRRVRATTLGAYGHQDVPFEKVVEDLAPDRDLGRSPLFQVKLVFQNGPEAALRLGEIEVSRFGGSYGVAKYDLTVALTEGKDGVSGSAEYATDLYEVASIERLLEHLRLALKAMAADAEQRVGDIALLTVFEQQQVLVEWNDTHRDDREQLWVHELFEKQAERAPDAVAVVCEERQLSYDVLNQQANRLGHYLGELGVRAEVRVALCMERSLEMVIGLLGVLKAGGAYVPMDPNYPTERLAYMLENAQAPVLLTQSRVSASLPGAWVQYVEIDREWEVIGTYPVTNPGARLSGTNLAYVIYTSGSTGRPKGVGLTQAGMKNLSIAQASAFGISTGAVVLQFASLAFDASVSEWTTALIRGGKLVVSGGDAVLAGDELRELVKREQVQVATIPPSVLASVDGEEMGVLRTLVVAGEACPKGLVEEWAKGRRMLDAYGPTETTVCATISGPLNSDGQPTIGRPMANTHVYVKDKWGQLTPTGVGGELYIGGVGVARSYVNRPDLTAERFVPDELSEEEGGRLYRTGDRVKWAESGQLEYLGRLDSQVKLRGYRIEPGEIEIALSQHSQIQHVVVVMREDDPGKRRLVAYIMGEEKLDDDQMRQYLRTKLPEYMVPSVFMRLEQIPLTASGKVDRRALPRPEQKTENGHYVAPRNEVEEILCAIWARLLRVEQVGVQDNFFELGGDSILSIQAIARAREMGLHLTARQFFEHQTIAGLAEVAERAVPGAEQELLTGPVALAPIQQLFFEWDQTNPHHFNQAVMLELKSRVDSVLLEQAVGALVRHHDSLRLSFQQCEGRWVQSYGEPTEQIPFSRRDLSGLAEIEQRGALREDATRVQASVSLDEGLLIRAVEYELGSTGRRLLLVIHHLAVDGVSWRILLEDLQRAYEQLEREEGVQLPPKTTSYRRWAERLKEYSRGEDLKREAQYWLSEEWEQAVPGLPVDEELGENTVDSARSVLVWLSVEETEALLQEVPAAYHTQINDVLLTALTQAFRRWSGHRSLLIEMEGHGREDIFEDVDLSRTVGWFTAVFPVRLTLESEHPGEALKEVKELLRAIPNRGLGYGVLRYMSDDEDVITRLSRRQQPQISFNYLGQFDQVLQESPLFNPVRDDSGPTHSADNRRPHLLDVNGKIVNGQLRISFIYSENIHREKTIEKLAGYYGEYLRRLITHCQSTQAGGYTPSDFPDANLTQQKLDGIISRLGKSAQRFQSDRGSK